MQTFDTCNALIEDLCVENQVAVISEQTNYWFVRSDGGSLFSEFRTGDYIGILWNKILNIQEVCQENEKALIEKYNDYYPESKRPGNIFRYHDILINQMKVGDIIIVPSENSKTFMVGRISGDFFYVEPTSFDEADEHFDSSRFVMKRRSVKWITTTPVPRESVDPMLLNLIYSQHTIFDANQYSEFINRIIYPGSMYYRDGVLHLVISVSKQDAIPASLIAGLISPVTNYCADLGTEIGIDFDDKSLAFQATVNSPGVIELVAILGKPVAWGIVTVFAILSLGALLTGGKVSFSKHKHIETNGLLKAISDFREKKTVIEKERLTVEALKINIEKLKALETVEPLIPIADVEELPLIIDED